MDALRSELCGAAQFGILEFKPREVREMFQSMNGDGRTREVQISNTCKVNIGISFESRGIVDGQNFQIWQTSKSRAVLVSYLTETHP